MVTRNIELTEEQDRLLEEVATDQGRTVSEVVREKMDEFLRAQAQPPQEELKRRAAALSGRFRSGLSDLSTEHDRYLEETLRD